MISDLRRKKIVTFFLWLVIISFIGTIFLVWGVGGKADKTNYAFKINGQEISMNEYQSTLTNMENTFKQLFGDQYNKFIKTIDIKERVKDEIIHRTLLYQEALEKKIPVSDIEIIEEINKIPSFKTNGIFDEEKYRQILKANGLPPASFEESIKRDLLINKMTFLIQNSVNVRNEEIKNEYMFRNSKAKISYLKISPDIFKNKVVLDNKSLVKYYNNNKEKYEKPKEVKVKYVKFNSNDFIKEINITDEEIQNYYIRNRLKYYEPEKIKVKHILISVKKWDNKTEVSEALNKIKSIQKELNNNGVFERLAEKYSDDQSSARNGGQIGFIKRGDVVPEFEKAAFKLKEGEISDIVKTQFGYHLIKVDEKIPAKMPTLNELKEVIKKEIFENKKNISLKEHVLSFYKDILNEGNITAYLQKNPESIKVYETDFFTKNDPFIPLRITQDIIDAIFNMEQSEVSKIYYIDNNAYIFEISDIKEAYIPSLSEIRDTVVNDYIRDNSKEIAIDELNKILTNGSNLDELSKQYNTKIMTTNYFKRIEPIDNIGSNTELQNSIFRIKEDKLIKRVFDINGYLYIVRVDDLKFPELDKMTAEEKSNIKHYIYEIKSKESLNEYLKNLRLKAKIKVSPFIE
jgi:peptidyl-prolyl cis-trans isomerase D